MHQKKLFRIFFLLLLIVPVFGVQAQQYNIMEAIPGFFNAGSSISFPDLISAIYKFGIWTVGIAALFMITVGGFMYASSAGNTSTAGSAKRIIADALLGLVVAMTSYLALNIINPDLVATNALQDGLNLTPSSGIPHEQQTAETAERLKSTGIQDLATQILSNTNIKLQGDNEAECSDAFGNKVSPKSNITELSEGKLMTICNGGCRTRKEACRGSAHPPKEMLEAMLKIAQTKTYTVTSIAGGQHGNTSHHYVPKALDIVPSGGDWNNYVTAFVSNGALSDQTFCEDPSKGTDKIKSLNCKVQHHIHVSFINK